MSLGCGDWREETQAGPWIEGGRRCSRRGALRRTLAVICHSVYWSTCSLLYSFYLHRSDLNELKQGANRMICLMRHVIKSLVFISETPWQRTWRCHWRILSSWLGRLAWKLVHLFLELQRKPIRLDFESKSRIYPCKKVIEILTRDEVLLTMSLILACLCQKVLQILSILLSRPSLHIPFVWTLVEGACHLHKG